MILLKLKTRQTITLEMKNTNNFGFYEQQHICYSAYMPRQFRLSVCHMRALCQNG